LSKSNEFKALKMQVIHLQKTTGEAVLFGGNMKKQPGKTHTVPILLTHAIQEIKRKRG